MYCTKFSLQKVRRSHAGNSLTMSGQETPAQDQSMLEPAGDEAHGSQAQPKCTGNDIENDEGYQRSNNDQNINASPIHHKTPKANHACARGAPIKVNASSTVRSGTLSGTSNS